MEENTPHYTAQEGPPGIRVQGTDLQKLSQKPLRQGAKELHASVLKPLCFEHLDSVQKKWLIDRGLQHDRSILGFDCTKETVTFLVDGESVERQLVQCWTRVMGYHRPVVSFNTGKKGEFAERVEFRAPRDLSAPADAIRAHAAGPPA